MNSANITIQQLQARVAESAEAVQEVKLNLVVSEAETHKLTKQLETARAESQNQMDRAAKIRAHSDQLEAQVKQRDDLLHELQYKLDLCAVWVEKFPSPRVGGSSKLDLRAFGVPKFPFERLWGRTRSICAASMPARSTRSSRARRPH